MESNLKGLLSSKKFDSHEDFVWLLEAIVNSFDAINILEKKSNIEKEICIKIYRENNLFSNNNGEINGSIDRVEIRDTGIGFTKERMSSFNTLYDSASKKMWNFGIGRISYLKYFEKININSFYWENEMKNINFDFSAEEEVKINEDKIFVDANHSGTTVLFEIPNKRYNNFIKNLKEITRLIISYFVGFLDSEIINKFSICECRLDDNGKEEELEKIDLLEEYRNNFVNFYEETTKINSYEFKIKIIKCLNNIVDGHSFWYIANKRKVEKFSLNIFNEKNLFSSEENTFFIQVCIESKFLDERVDEERKKIDFDKDNNLFDYDKDLSKIKEKILKNVEKILKNKFENEIRSDLDSNFNLLIKKINNDCKEFAFLKEDIRKELYSDGSEKDLIFNKKYLINQNYIKNTKKLKNDLGALKDKKRESLKQINDDLCKKKKVERVDIENFKRNSIPLKSIENLELYNLIKTRKINISFLNRMVCEKDENHKTLYEKDIHEFIVPMGKKLDDSILIGESNLWMINEEFMDVDYLYSDMPFKKMTEIKNKSQQDGKRPDVILYKRDHDSPPNIIKWPLISIVEFKRLERTFSNSKENPVDQVIEYIDSIEAIRHSNGRELKLNIDKEQCLFNAYILCDIDDDLMKKLKNDGFFEVSRKMYYTKYLDANNDNKTRIIFNVFSYDYLIEMNNKKYKNFFDSYEKDCQEYNETPDAINNSVKE